MIGRFESNMLFCFEKNYYYSIEEDMFYKKITSRYQAKVCDFIVYKEREILFIEAKSSAPKNKEDLNNFAQDIYQKFLDSLLIFIATKNDRKNTYSKNMSENLKKVSLKSDIKLVLIINNMAKKDLSFLKEFLSRKMRKFLYIFSISDIVVMNDLQAKSKNIIK